VWERSDFEGVEESGDGVLLEVKYILGCLWQDTAILSCVFILKII